MSKVEITAVNRTFEEAARKGDLERIASLYTPDAIVMPPDGPFVRGRDDIKKMWGNVAQQLGLKDVRLETMELEFAGDMANEVGEAKLTLASGAASVKYVVVWKKLGDGWKLHRDIWNAMAA